MEGAKKRIFGAFKAFLTYERRKNDTSSNFAAFLRQNFDANGKNLRCRKNAAKCNKVSCLRLFLRRVYNVGARLSVAWSKLVR